LRGRIGVDDKALLIGSLGNLHPAKGYEYLIRAAAQLDECYSNVHFVIAGDIKPHLIGDLQKLMQVLGVANRVHFIGFVAGSVGFLAQLDIFLLPSISEGFSIATVEAMATGLPVIVTRCGGPEEIVSHGEDALVVDVASYEAICSAVRMLISRPPLMAQISSRARKSVTDRFNSGAMVDKYTALYARYTLRNL
jgi:glycosyltransferase involved in cell wall biosynthesis